VRWRLRHVTPSRVWGGVALSEFDRAAKLKPRAELDRLNIISIDTHLEVRPDSMALLWAAREVVEEPDFQEVLDSVRERVDEIESLHRTRELTVCLVRSLRPVVC